MPEAALTTQPGPAPETNPTPAGSVSCTVTAPLVAMLAMLSADSVHAPAWPTVNVPGWLLNRATSGAAFTAVVVRLESFRAFASPAVAATARLPTDGAAAASACTLSVAVALSFGAMAAAWVAVTVAPAAFTLQPVPAPETNARPGASTSVMVTAPVVGPVPRFVTVSAYAPGPPTVNGAPTARFTSWRSGTGGTFETVVGSTARSLAASTSPVAWATAVVVTPGAAPPNTVTSTANEALSGGAIGVGEVAGRRCRASVRAR